MHYLPAGDTLVSATDDGVIRLWKTQSGEPVRQLKPSAWIAGMFLDNAVLSSDGKFLASSARKELTAMITLWDLGEGKEIRHWKAYAGARCMRRHGHDGMHECLNLQGEHVLRWD